MNEGDDYNVEKDLVEYVDSDIDDDDMEFDLRVDWDD
jgi:hypothetical protein